MKYVLLALMLAQYPTRSDLKTQGRNGGDLVTVQPGWGTMVIKQGDHYVSALSGNAVIYRTSAPKQPGPCELEGTGAIALDADGYLYFCHVKKGATITTPSPVTRWMRTASPLVETW